MTTRRVHRPGGMYDQVLRFLDNRGAEWTTTEVVAGQLHISRNYARDLLRDAVDAGLAEKPSPRGKRWRIARRGRATWGRKFPVMLTYAQARALIEAAEAVEIVDMDLPYVRGREAGIRALVNGRRAIEDAIPAAAKVVTT